MGHDVQVLKPIVSEFSFPTLVLKSDLCQFSGSGSTAKYFDMKQEKKCSASALQVCCHASVWKTHCICIPVVF